ncbi:MAG: hypothetical protein ACO1RX_17845 [Candidatus Sericytochromatia bacterium]
MQINKLIQSTESQPIKPGKNLSQLQPNGPAQGSHSEITHEQEHHGAQQSGKDKLDASTPASRTKPTVLDFIEQEGQPIDKGGMQAQTLAYPESGEDIGKNKPSINRTLAYPENGESIDKGGMRAQTLAYPESGEDRGRVKPPTDCLPERGNDVKPPRGQTKMIGENGEPGIKPPFAQTHALGENGDHFPSKPPHGQTKAIGENGEPGRKPPLGGGNLNIQTLAMGENGEHGHFRSQLNKLDDSQ